MTVTNDEQKYYYGAYADAENHLVTNSYNKIAEFCKGKSNSIQHKFFKIEDAENWIKSIPGYFDFSSLKDYELVVVSTKISKNYENLIDILTEDEEVALETNKYESYHYMLELLNYVKVEAEKRNVKRIAVITTDRIAVYYMDAIFNINNIKNTKYNKNSKKIKEKLVNKIKELRESLDIKFFTFDDDRKNEHKKYLEEVKNSGSDKYVVYGRTK